MLEMALPWPIPIACPYSGTAAGRVLALTVGGLCSHHLTASGRNLAPKCDRSNLEEVELQD